MPKKKVRKPRARPPTVEPEPEGETFEQMLERLKITKWDLILIGDGSGNKWGYPCGWAVTAIERNSRDRKVFYGAMSSGTVNFAEMMAYLQPLTWYMNETKSQRAGDGRVKRSTRRIHIITDSAYCRNRGDSRDLAKYTNKVLWGVFELIQRQGFQLEWHWEKRDTVALNTYADRLSKAARIMFRDAKIQHQVDRRGTVFDLNPWE